MGINLYQFIFANQEDKMKVLNGNAWTFNSQCLILKPWSEDIDFQKECFNLLQLWAHIWNLPFRWILKETDLKFKNVFNQVIDVIIPESGSNKGRFIKILAEIELDKPLH